MIRIIKNTMTEPVSIECKYCKSVLEYTFNDIQRTQEYNLLGLETHKRYIVCPVCKMDIVFDDLAKAVEVNNAEKI